jgi:hypothetical protein
MVPVFICVVSLRNFEGNYQIIYSRKKVPMMSLEPGENGNLRTLVGYGKQHYENSFII